MEDLPINIKKRIARYKEISVYGLTLYPVRVKYYDEFLIGRAALEVMHQSLKANYLRVPLLSALYAIDFQAAMQGETPTGLFSRSLVCLALALRLAEGGTIEQMVRQFEIAVDPNDSARLLRLRFTGADGQEHSITPAQFADLRKIIAAQNGVRLESDKANPDIVKAEKDMASAGGIDLDVNLEDWISAVSSLSGASEDEIDDWPILKFQRRSQSFQRILDYLICGIGECGGMVSWPKGNPHPHPFFDRVTDSGVLRSLGGSADDPPSVPPQAGAALRDMTKNL